MNISVSWRDSKEGPVGTGTKNDQRHIKREKISIVIPALNEEEAIEKTIKSIPKERLQSKAYQVQILVVDNGSEDRTRDLARKAGAEVVFEPRKGKGTAIRTALESIDADYIFMLDGDYTYPPIYIPEMLKLLKHNDVVIGSRLAGQRQKGAMSRFNLIGNHLLSLMASVLYSKKISDVCTGYWGFKAKVLKSLNLRATGFELEAEMFSQLAKKGCSIAELPIYYTPRATPAKLNAFKDGIRISRTLITRRFQ